MKTSHILASLVVATVPALAFAAPTGKTRPQHSRPAGEVAEVLRPFDKNGNHQIDGDELAAVQKEFSALGKLDKNANGQIEQNEVAAIPVDNARVEGFRARAAEGLKRVDLNGNHRIDPDEIQVLEKMLANGKGEMMKRLDQNNNGKLEESELARLNERLEKGATIGRPGAGKAPSPSFRRPPEKPAETIKPAEKTEKPVEGAKVEEKKIEFGS